MKPRDEVKVLSHYSAIMAVLFWVCFIAVFVFDDVLYFLPMYVFGAGSLISAKVNLSNINDALDELNMLLKVLPTMDERISLNELAMVSGMSEKRITQLVDLEVCK